MELGMYTLSMPELQENVNIGKDMVLDALASDGVITDKQAGEMKRTYAVVLSKWSWLSILFRGKKDDSVKYIMVKTFPSLEECK